MHRIISGIIVMTAATASVVVGVVPPAAADFGGPQSIGPADEKVYPNEQATDRQGDTAYFYRSGDGASYLRIRHRDGRLSTPRLVSGPVDGTVYNFHVAVAARGDGVVTWIEYPPEVKPGVVYARWFTRSGRLGAIRAVAPADHDVADDSVIVRDEHHAVVSWSSWTSRGTRPYARTFASSGRLGATLALGHGPDSSVPLMAVYDDRDTLLVWSNDRLLARRLTRTGHLSRTSVLYDDGPNFSQLSVDQLALDRSGVAHAVGTAWYPVAPELPSPEEYDRGVELSISPRLHRLGRIRAFTPKHLSLDRVAMGVAGSGEMVVGWQRNSVDGAWLRRIGRGGGFGKPVQVSTGSLGEIALGRHGDGIASSTGRVVFPDRSVHNAAIRVTTIRDGHVLRTRRVARSDYDVIYLDAGLLPRHRGTVTYERPLAGQVMAVSGR
jgi:hypothetical protein